MLSTPVNAERSLETPEPPDDLKRPDTNDPNAELLAVVGHELRGPLAAIRNALLILKQCGDRPDMRQWAIGVMDRQTTYLNRLIEALLNVSHFQHGKVQLNKEPVNLTELVELALESVQPHIQQRGHLLEVRLPSDPILLHADPIRLEQVLTNLLENAAKFTDDGGQICLAAEPEGTEIVMWVRDSGVGIDPTVLPHLFEPFWQSKPNGQAHGGLGLGLTLVRRLVEMHGGSVTAHSDGPGQGSKFVVRLPYCPPVASNPGNHASEQAGRA
jgi:signal transduction histidine kinase